MLDIYSHNKTKKKQFKTESTVCINTYTNIYIKV